MTTELLTERDLTIDIIEAILGVFKEAHLYTLAHKEGSILGPVEQRKIFSSSLTHKLNHLEDLHRLSFLVPGVSNNHFISCENDLIINLSRGLSHGLKKCDSTKQITYLLDEEAMPKGKKIIERMFKPYVNNWAVKKLNQIDELWVSSESLKKKLEKIYKKEIIVVSPFIKIQDFPMIPKNVYPHDYYIINAENIKMKEALLLFEIMESKNNQYRFIGKDSHLGPLKEKLEKHLFLGKKCNRDLAPILAASRGVMDFSGSSFPSLAICALSSGRPVIVQENDFINKEGVFSISTLDQWSILDGLERLEAKEAALAPEKLHNQIKRFHQLKFKGLIQRRTSALFTKKA